MCELSLRPIRLFAASGLLCLSAAVFVSCSGGGGGSDDTLDIVEPEQTDFLYVQQGASGRVTARRDARSISIEISGVEPETVYVSGDSDHEAGSLDTGAFVRNFSWEPVRPSAALVYQNGDKKETAMLGLSRPRYDAAAKTLRYSVEILDDAGADSLAELSDDPVNFVPDTFDDANLYIDDQTLTTCSGAMASSTSIAVSGGHNTLGSILTGDVAAASSDGAQFGGSPVIFTQSLPADSSETMVAVRVGDNILTGSPFLCVVRGDLTVVRLEDLQAGDILRFSDGSDRTVDLVSKGDYSGPVSAIATNTKRIPGAGRFLSANGFVVTEHFWTGEVDLPED